MAIVLSAWPRFEKGYGVNISHHQYICRAALQRICHVNLVSKMISTSTGTYHSFCTMTCVTTIMQNYDKIVILYCTDNGFYVL